jgi:D-beta-D-heptose 7-phosphate kinase/D-beta-D-heptose 1-phosphate adenosyltransferase
VTTSIANSKIVGIRALKAAIDRLKGEGKRVVFTNGCFDVLHRGHVKLLSDAKRFGDILVVGLNSDSSVRKIKGKSRPIRSQRERAAILASLAAVDFVTIFHEPTPLEVIKTLVPDVLVKGGDWRKDSIVGARFVESRGGRVVRVPLLKGYSTTSLIRRIKKSYG